MNTVMRPLLSSFLIVASITAGSCAAGRGQTSDLESDDRAPSLAEAIASAQENLASVGAMSDNGLEVRMWLMPERPEEMAAAFQALAEDLSSRPELAALASNGFRFYRVPIDALDRLRLELGGSSRSEQWWLGQAPEWRELWTRSLGRSKRGIAVDGRVRRFDGGVVSLLIRAWTLKTEHGPRMQFELAPFYSQRPGGYRQAVNEPQRALFAAKDTPGEVMHSMAINTRLEPGFAYVLTCDLRAEAELRARVPTDSRKGEVRGDIGPAADFGPAIAGPSTVADTMLRGDEPVTNRLVIVLIPRIPAALYPPDLLVSDSAATLSETTDSHR